MSVWQGLKKLIIRLGRENRGPTATEYAVLLVLIVFGALSAISLVGSLVSGSFSSTAQAIPDGAGVGASQGSGKSKKPKKPKKSKKPKKRRRSRGKTASSRKASDSKNRPSLLYI